MPLEAYLNALETEDDDQRGVHLEAYGRHVRDHLRKARREGVLGQLLPHAGVRRPLPAQRSLLHRGARAVTRPDPGRRQQQGADRHPDVADRPAERRLRLAPGADGRIGAEIADLGRQLHKRIATMAGHISDARPRDQRVDREHLQRHDRVARARVLVSAPTPRARRRVGQGERVAGAIGTRRCARSAPELVEGDPDDIRVTALPEARVLKAGARLGHVRPCLIPGEGRKDSRSFA